jgi:hydrogenase maturation protein HypF
MEKQLGTYHIHIKGIVQGVGFRPFIYKLAKELGLSGWVNNTYDGVHIQVNATTFQIDLFTQSIQKDKPDIATITDFQIQTIPHQEFSEFDIVHSDRSGEATVLLTPDFGLCEDCRQELLDTQNRRYRYPFITCTNCGPRYSIINAMPYDRPWTTMEPFTMCPSCRAEYDDPVDPRYFSQTNSCQDCAIELTFYESGKWLDFPSPIQGMEYIVEQWKRGKIVAIKGIGGYLLTCSATDAEVIQLLRKRKKRPTKPFAVMYHDLFCLAEDVELDAQAAGELRSPASPIVLLSLKNDRMTDIAVRALAPNLGQIGVMLPYTPLYAWLLEQYGQPIVATSGNISNSTIIYENDKAIEHLSEMAELVVLNNRDIVVPQDDSVLKISPVKREKVLLRRSRGLAPAYLPQSGEALPGKTILSMGASLKSVFSLLHQNNIYISQYLGNTDLFDAQENYRHTLDHILDVLGAQPDIIVVDKHPNYFSRRLGEELADKYQAALWEVQHHKAHLWAVLGEHRLWDEKVLGVIWDGTGYGDDGNIWGGEFFVYEYGEMSRATHLDYFNFILGDKMPREPRVSAFAILEAHDSLNNKFTEEEWRIYQKILEQNRLKSSSAGRLYDAAASVLLDIDYQSYEGEAAMQLEQKAYEYFRKFGATTFYTYLKEEEIPENFPRFILTQLIRDRARDFDLDFLAAKFHITLAHYIFCQAKKIGVRKVAFSGGVFQNGWMVDLVKLFMDADFNLYFHKEVSPNDEGISFGQLRQACYKLQV